MVCFTVAIAESYLAEVQSLIITLTLSQLRTPDFLSSKNCTCIFYCGYSILQLHINNPIPYRHFIPSRVIRKDSGNKPVQHSVIEQLTVTFHCG